jgi:CBS domain-containing protein
MTKLQKRVRATRQPRRASAKRSAARRHTSVTRDIMSRDVVALSPDLTLRDTIELLAARHIGGAPVIVGGRVAGVLSVSDILEFEVATPGVPATRAEASEQGELDVSESWEDEEAEAPGAYFSEFWEDAGADVSQRFEALAGPEWDMLDEHTVSEVMTEEIRAVRPDTTIPKAAAYMLKNGIHRALVLNDKALIGIITATDIMRAVAEGRLSRQKAGAP